jgi:hypothetical protein
MLPPVGSGARTQLEREALRIGIAALRRGEGVADALYLVYSAFRVRFLEERGLMDEVPGRGFASREALEDARILERHVCDEWRTIILAASSDSSSTH